MTEQSFILSPETREYLETTFEYLHSIPEPSCCEYKTSSFVASELRRFGYQVHEKVADTGVIGILDSGKPGPVLGLRADMDCLRYLIDGKEVFYHGCGHDGHTSMLLTTAKAISEQGISKGKLYLVFQPAEEGGQGAQRMRDTGCLNEIQELVGMHVRSNEDEKLGDISVPFYHQESRQISIQITGMSSHGSKPHQGINAAEAAALVVMAVNSIHCNPMVPHSLKCTGIQAGEGSMNTIPGSATMCFDMRAADHETALELMEKFHSAVEHAVSSVGASWKLISQGGCPVCRQDDELCSFVRDAAADIVGKDHAHHQILTTGGEDFYEYGEIPGIKLAYISLGSGLLPKIHAYGAVFDHQALVNGAEIFIRIVQKRLG